MALATWWQGDALPTLAPLPTFHAETALDISLITAVTHLQPDEVQSRLGQGHRVYIASYGDQAVGYGWVATRSGDIGELDIHFSVKPSDRYLWDFATLPAWRGRGIYPHLLQTIIVGEMPDVHHFWIIHAPENRASERGILKAGFQQVAELSFVSLHQAAAVPFDDWKRAWLGSSLLGVPLLDSAALSPCWNCVIQAQLHHLSSVPCLQNGGTLCPCEAN